MSFQNIAKNTEMIDNKDSYILDKSEVNSLQPINQPYQKLNDVQFVQKKETQKREREVIGTFHDSYLSKSAND